MILTRAPLRLSFFGGGTDLASHYRNYGGAVLSTTIDKYMYIAVNTTSHDYIRLSYSEIETVKDYTELKHNIVRNAIEHYSDITKIGLEISSFADVPTVGTGLGSSSTFSVALLQALSELNSRKFMPTKKLIAEWACDLEIKRCESPIGKQDQYAAAYGGLNHIQFHRNDNVKVTQIYAEESFQNNFLMFYTGRKREANSILKGQSADPKHAVLEKMKSQVHTGIQHIKQHRYDDFGDLLDEAWHLKKQLADGISDDHLDYLYNEAKSNGALGGKILGAGGGGYFVFYCSKKNQEKLKMRMHDLSLIEIPFSFTLDGVETVYKNDY
jgi:D-glycero-alpha-D-manno-heptose-7-phosphate kinase